MVCVNQLKYLLSHTHLPGLYDVVYLVFWTLSFDQCKECSLHLRFVKYWLDLWADKWFSPRTSQWPVSSSAGLSCAPLAPFPSTIVDRVSLVQAQWKKPQLPWVHDYNGCVMSRRCHFCLSSPSLPSGSYVLTITSTSVLSELYKYPI